MMQTATRRSTRSLLAGALWLGLVALAGCGQESTTSVELEGEVGAGESGQAFASPNFSCTDNRGAEDPTWVALRGQFGELGGPPTVSLERSADIYGSLQGDSFTKRLSPGDRVRMPDDQTVEVRIDGNLDLRPGIYDVVVDAGDTEARKSAAFGVAPRPSVDRVGPGLACLEQGNDRGVVVRGGPFLVPEEGSARPDVTIGDLEVTGDDAVEATDCRDLGAAFGPYRACSALELDVSADDLSSGSHDVSVSNLGDGACASRPDEDGVALQVAGAPTLDSVQKGPFCSRQKAYDNVELRGSNFLRVESDNNTRLPAIRIAGETFRASSLEECETFVDQPGVKASSCSVARLQLEPGELDTLATGDSPSTSPDAGVGSDAGTGSDAGSGDDDAGTSDAGNPDAGSGSDSPRDFVLEQLDVSIRNPDPARCRSDSDALSVVPPPVVANATPDPVCNADQDDSEAKTVTLEGSGFLVVGDQRPTVDIGGNSYDVTETNQCQSFEVGDTTVESCREVAIELPPGEFDQGAIQQTSVQNPAPADCTSGGSATLRTTFVPEVSDVVPASRPNPSSRLEPVCTTDGDRNLVVYGSNFYALGDQLPEVSFGMAGSWEADSASGCTTVPVDGETRETRRCSILRVTVPQGELQPAQDPTASFPVSVTNPNGASCRSSNSATFYTATSPTIAADGLTENFACLAAGARQFTLTGSNFLKFASGGSGGVRRPVVEVGGEQYEASSMSDCVTLPASSNNADGLLETCTQLTFRLPQDALAPSDTSYELRLHQPTPVSCSGSATTSITVDPEPTVGSVEVVDAAGDGSTFQAGPACGSQTDDTVVVTGQNFRLVEGSSGQATIDGTSYVLPRVYVGSATYGAPRVSVPDPAANCTELTGRSRSVLECSRIAFDAPAGKDGLGEGLHEVEVLNPLNNFSQQPPSTRGCRSRNDYRMRLTAAPTLDSIEPNLACMGRSTNTLMASGEDFLVVRPAGGSTQRPELTFRCQNSDQCGDTTKTFEASAGMDCTGLPREPGQAETASCKRLQVDIPEEALPPGGYAVWVENPGGNDCASGTAGLLVEPDPSVASIQPSPVCTEQNEYSGSDIAIVEGDNFLKVDGRMPTVQVGGTTVSIQNMYNAGGDCTSETILGRTVETCSIMEVVLPEDSLSQGAISEHRVEVTNPAPVDCRSEENVVEKDVPPPEVSSANFSLYEACTAGASNTMVVSGDHYYYVDNANQELSTPNVEVTHEPSNETRVYRTPTLGGQCTTLTNTSTETRKCDLLRFSLDKHASNLQDGDFTINVLNPQTAQCSESHTTFLSSEAAPDPVISNIEPITTCSTNGTLRITGDNFQNGVDVRLGGEPADDVEYVDSTEVVATWRDAPHQGTQTVEVVNPDGCSASDSTDITVEQGPLAVFLKPPVHYNELELEGKLYIRGADASEVVDVRIRGPNDVVRTLSFRQVNEPGTSDQLFVTLPDTDPKSSSGDPLLPGTYDLQVRESFATNSGSIDCGRWQEGAVEVVGNNDLALTDVVPQSGFRQTTTDIELVAASSPGSGQTNFRATPRVYLEPTSNTQGTEAIPLGNDIYHNGTKVTATVPADIPPGNYRVIVINPSPGREVGVLEPPNGFTVADDPAPVVDNVDPATWITPSNPRIEVRVEGENFRVDSSQTDPVTIECQEGSPPNDITVQNTSSNELVLEVETDQMTTGDSCIMTVENQDRTVARYGPITTFNPNFDFVNFESAPSMQENRRGHTMVSSSPTDDETFIYVLGGDNGPVPLTKGDNVQEGTKRYQIYNSSEYAPLDRFGDIQLFRSNPSGTPSGGRVFASATRIRDFVYFVGGEHIETNDSNEVQSRTVYADVQRAHVLDPEHVPRITDIEYEFIPVSQGAGGLSSGTYYYRVSATHVAGNGHNPGGETLTSPVVPVYVPRYDDFDVQVEITWDSGSLDPAQLSNYRLYRSENPDLAVGQEFLLEQNPLSESDPTVHTDNGSSPPGSQTYLRTGSLGQWHSFGSLETARKQHAVKSVVDPNDPSTVYLYAIGGVGSGGSELGSIERMVISDDPSVDRDAQLSGNDPVQILSESLSTPRADLASFVATSANSDITSKNLYAVGGDEGDSGLSDTLEWWTIGAGSGSLTPSGNNADVDIDTRRAGFVGSIANDYALVFGGGIPSSAPSVAPDDTASRSNELTNAGSITGWRDLSDVGMTARYRYGGVSAGSFLYITGGTTQVQYDPGENDPGSEQEGVTTDSVEFSVVGKTRK